MGNKNQFAQIRSIMEKKFRQYPMLIYIKKT